MAWQELLDATALARSWLNALPFYSPLLWIGDGRLAGYLIAPICIEWLDTRT